MTEAKPFPDRLTLAGMARIRAEYEAAAAARRALLARCAPLWMRALAWLPNPQRPLQDWVATEKAKRMSSRI